MPHKLRLLQLSVLLLILGFASIALASDGPPPPAPDVAEWLKALYAAVTSKSWGIVAGLAMTPLVYALRRFGPSVLKSTFGGIVLAFLIALAGTLGAATAAGATWSLGLVAGALATAATAAGVWEWLKDLIPGVEDAAKTVAAPKAAGS